MSFDITYQPFDQSTPSITIDNYNPQKSQDDGDTAQGQKPTGYFRATVSRHYNRSSSNNDRRLSGSIAVRCQKDGPGGYRSRRGCPRPLPGAGPVPRPTRIRGRQAISYRRGLAHERWQVEPKANLERILRAAAKRFHGTGGLQASHGNL